MQALSSGPAPSLLSIAGRVGHAFEIQTMIAGFACHARGVEIASADGRSAQAIVKSKRTHTVDFRVDSGKLVVKCSCPAESMGLHACKHTWAALLEIDKQGGLADLRTKRGPLVLERELGATPSIEEPPRSEKKLKARAATTSERPAKPAKAAKRAKDTKPAKETKPAKDTKPAKPAKPAKKPSDASAPSPRSPRASALPPAPRGSQRRSKPRS